MITYSALVSHVQPYFLSRWWDALASADRILFYANCAIQDAYNIDQSTFTYKIDKDIVWVLNWTKNKFITSNSIRKVQECIGYLASWSSIELVPTLFIPKDVCNQWCQFTTWNSEILTSTDIVRIDVLYTMDYEWASYPQDFNKAIQLPNRYIPAVIKMMMDWAAPINLMSWESATSDFFSHAMTRFNKLSEEDWLTDMYHLNM